MSTVHPLHGNQMKAVAPDETVWLSASAGTGKTQVLSSRVLRLMLQPSVDPSAILCLTFTKAGATEMAARIKERLARWVRAKEADLAKELQAIGADFGPKSLARARTLFAKVLDCPGGGLRIDTIHAFSQWLLAAFPHEAGLIPGTRPMEDRERAILARQVLADLLVDAEEQPGDPELADALADLSLRMGPDAVELYLLRCAQAREAWFGLGAFTNVNMRERVLALLGLPGDADAEGLAVMCADAAFDVQSLRKCMEINAGWSAKTGQEGAAQIGAWLAGDEAARIAAFDDLAAVFLKKDGEPRASSSQIKIDPSYSNYCARVIDCITVIRERAILFALAERLIPALRLGRAFALKWEEAKQREGVIDFDDQIRQAAALLGESQLAEWIRYKLDRRFDHILVDEAQDTNRAQWDIIFALAGEFWTGLGQHDNVMRTLFVVGDYKQAIFRFQGTNPENFSKARDRVSDGLAGAVENVRQLRSNQSARPLREYGLDRSFRSSQPLLDFVDAAIGKIGHQRFGLADVPEPHIGWDRPGHVVLWRPVGQAVDADEFSDEAEEGGDKNWFSKPDRQMAENIARQVREWLDESGEGLFLASMGRRARAGEVMVLVRKRRDLAGLIVARLHAHRVPVAGVDRLRIGDPLAVRDLLAAIRFAAQPLDDLTLAALLVSPLIGWSQDDLLRFGYREPRVRLWNHLRSAADPDAAPAMEKLLALLGRADFEAPHQLLTWLLTGPWEGRRKLVARLGREANDPIDELINAAHAYAAVSTPSLVGFLQWFEAGEGELKREADGAGDLVRVMTVHGSKGLQAPIVILADATGDPQSSRSGGMDLPDPAAPEKRAIPLPALRKEERIGRIADHFEKERREEMEEHWRLLYVAMTRAEEALFIGGALGSRDRGVPPEESWYTRLRELFPAGEELADSIWAGRLEWGQPAKSEAASSPSPAELPFAPVLPSWLVSPAPHESRPPKPLAPSNLGEEDAPELPYPPGASAAAARRGTLTHKLLERLPAVPLTEREQAGLKWLNRNGADLAGDDRSEILAAVLAVLAEPEWAPLFGAGSLPEVPVAAIVGERVVAGTIDRLLIEDDRVLIVDFKTSRRPPETIAQVPRSILRQMAAYCAALEQTFPGRRVEAALLYTAAPRLIALPADVMESHKSGLI